MRLLRPAALLACVALLASCGGDDRARAAEYQSAARAISDAESAALAAQARTADYRSPERAAASTRAYAQAFADAAERLHQLRPPEVAREEHEALIRVYRDLASRCSALALQLASAPDVQSLDQRTRELAALVEQAGTRERAARDELERALSTLVPAA